MASKLDKVQDKINKLIKLRDGAMEIDSPNEAEVASKKIQALLTEYNLEESELHQNEPDQIDSTIITVETFTKMKWSKTDAGWKEGMLHMLARNNFCLAVTEGHRKYNDKGKLIKTPPSMQIFGKEVNRETVIYLWSQLVPRVALMGRNRFKEIEHSINEKKGAFLRGYYAGVTRGIEQQLIDQGTVMKKEAPKLGELMIVSEKLVRAKMEDHYGGKLSNGRRSRLSGVNGASMGKADGKGMSINKGVGSGGKGSLRLS